MSGITLCVIRNSGMRHIIFILVVTVEFMAGRCHQACIDEQGSAGKWDAKLKKCFCMNEIPLSYMDSKKIKQGVRLEPTTEPDDRD